MRTTVIACLGLVACAAASGPPATSWTKGEAAVPGTIRPGLPDAALHVRGGDVKPAPALYENAVALGEKKAAAPARDIATLGLISGAHIAFGGFLAVTIGANMPAMASSNPGLQKLIFGLFGLPFGLYMVLAAGGELFTGNTALVTAALIEGKATLTGLLKNWSVSYVGNLIGSLAIVKLVSAAGLVATPAVGGIATKKCSLPFFETFLRGVVCNWMVCMAVWVATGASNLVEKYLAMLLPVTAFVAFGAEHSVANMFLIPLGMDAGASVSWMDFFVKNLLPVTLGNIVGGAVCQTGLYSAVYGSLLK